MRNLLPVLLLCSVQVFGVHYYVDFDAGNDSSAGTSTGTAWRTIPGTRLTHGQSSYKTSTYAGGTFVAGSVRVVENTTFHLKGGTTHSSADTAGAITIYAGSGNFYSAGLTNIVFVSDWGTGNAVFDGAGMGLEDAINTIALVTVQIDGVTFRNMTIQNSDLSGVQFKELAGTGAALNGITVDGCTFTGNGEGYATDVAGSGAAQLFIKKSINTVITNCVFNGSANFVNGCLTGDSGKSAVATVVDCVAYNHKGDLSNNDSGIGFKALNSQITYINCTSTNNLKGFDAGTASPGASNMVYLYKNCLARSNIWGLNLNCEASAISGTFTARIWNTIIQSNASAGLNLYAGPMDITLVHNLIDHSGILDGVPEGASIIITPNDVTDAQVITFRCYNNIFRRAYGSMFLNKYAVRATTKLTMDQDWNSYEQRSTEDFCTWCYYSGPESFTFAFGTHGPGHASGNWYNFYSNNTTPPSSGTGHFHCDTNSKGTGCTVTTLPSINSDYTLASAYPGTDLSAKSWYQADYATDRAGTARGATPDMGPYQFSSGGGGGGSSTYSSRTVRTTGRGKIRR